MRAIIEDDLVTGAIDGSGVVGHEIPDHLAALPLARLRWDGTTLIDAADVSTFYVDDRAQKHVKPGAGRQRLQCAWNAALSGVPGAWVVSKPSEVIAPAVRAEFDRRIGAAFEGRRNSILSYAIQLNGLVAIGRDNGRSVAETLTPEQQADVKLIWELDDWETAMIVRREAMIAAVDAAFADDSKWPPFPAACTAAWLKDF